MVEAHLTHREAGIVVVAIVAIDTQRDIPSHVVEFPIELQHAIERGRFAIRKVDIILGVDQHARTVAISAMHPLCQFLQSFLRERLFDKEIGILVVGSRKGVLVAIVGGIRDAGAEHDVGHRVGGPLQSHLPVPGGAARVVLVDAVGE